MAPLIRNIFYQGRVKNRCALGDLKAVKETEIMLVRRY